MTIRRRQKETAGGAPQTNNRPDKSEVLDADQTCRCKEISKKSLPELLKVMVKDLTLPKKKK